MNPKISFVIPVYNKRPEVFERCLKSLFDQSLKAIEVICVFDGANEILEGVAAKYKTKRFVIEHSGAPRARNFGFEKTSGDYVSFWDADCYAKPHMASRWLEEFETTGADFVYSDYEFADQSGQINGYPFDPYLLQCGNYIATMFPMKRGVFPGFDESLKAAQDWDLWLTIVENGGKGSYIKGPGFSTEPPDSESISGKEWNSEKFRLTYWKVREKHKIHRRDILVAAGQERGRGLYIAKKLDADFSAHMDSRPHDYKLVINLGFNENSKFEGIPQEAIKIQYWLPLEIEALEEYPFKNSLRMLSTIRDLGAVHWVNDHFSKNRLENLTKRVEGFPPIEVVPLPSDTSEAATSLPEKFRVLLEIDSAYQPYFRTIKQDLPYIDFDELDPVKNPYVNPQNYSLLVSFQRFPTVNESIKFFLVNGRNVISNVQAPYCGFFDLEREHGDVKQSLITEIRDARYLKFNQKAKDYYTREVDPEVFKEKLASLIRKEIPLEVIA